MSTWKSQLMRHSVVVVVVVVVARSHVCRLREKRHRLRLCDLYTETPSGKKRATSLRCVESGAFGFEKESKLNPA